MTARRQDEAASEPPSSRPATCSEMGSPCEQDATEEKPAEPSPLVADITERADHLMRARLRLLEFSLTHSLDELLVATLDEAEMLTGSQLGFYHFVGTDQRTISLQAWSTKTVQGGCSAAGKGRHYAVCEAGVWADCIRQRRPVIHNQYATLPHRKGMPPGHAQIIRELVVPVIRGDRIVAVLCVGNKPRDYTPSDVDTLSRLADLVWDTADRKRAEETLAQLRRLLVMNEMVDGMAHKINQPLCSIVNYARACGNVLAQAAPRLDLVRDWCQRIGGEASRAGEIVRRLRDFVQRPGAHRAPVDINDVVRESISSIALDASRHRVEVSSRLADEASICTVDRNQIQHLLDHLLRNACEAMEGGADGARRLTVRTAVAADFVEVSIADSGPGLDHLEPSRIFEPFVTPKPRGAGMGLVISRSIVEAHGGRIWATANPEGGATFHFTLPVAAIAKGKAGR